MVDINQLRNSQQTIVMIGSHPGIIQSILDFDYLSGKNQSSITAIIAAGRNYERYFFGKKEIFIPVFSSVENISPAIQSNITLLLNVSSARRVLESTRNVFEQIPNLIGGVIFAEDVPEKHALELYHFSQERNKFLIGPASVGLLVPRILKLGAIGGVDARQFSDSKLFSPGNIAVFSASGGMTNEIIRVVANSGKSLSFSLAFGGDRFPMITPQEAFMIAQKDSDTEAIVYFGELGGVDEYEIAAMLKSKQFTKKVVAYIAGTISDLFKEPPQFGHAKAMAKTGVESAHAKRNALRDAGALVPESFSEFVEMIQALPSRKIEEYTAPMEEINNRKHALISTSISGDKDSVPYVLGEDLLSFVQNNSFAYGVASMFLGKKITSKELENFVDFVLRLLVDHGPYVSGAVNTIVTARAGKDLPSSLSAGLLTVGPRFGGAINHAAQNWLAGVEGKKSAQEYVESFASRKEYIAGIGHRKYRIDLPDPRVTKLIAFSDRLTEKKHVNFAQSIEKVTTAKKGNLILNVDGAIAAVLLDILSEKENYSSADLQKLIGTEFFNALFVLSRSVGFIAHFLDQKRLDEGLFRLQEEDVALVE